MTRRRKQSVEREARELLDELTDTAHAWKGRDMPQAVSEEFSRKSKRAEQLVKSLNGGDMKADYLREIPPENEGLFPASPQDRKGAGDVAGYISLGDAVIRAEGFRDFMDAGMPRLPQVKVFSSGDSQVVDVKGKSYIALTSEQRRAIETKAIPTLGSGVIEPSRLPVVPQVLADMDLRLRDVIPIARTSSDSVTYLREESYTPGAEIQTPGEPKGESTVEYTAQTAEVLTMATHMPVLVQQLQDWGQLQSRIDNRLRYDVRLLEESEMVYGAGGSGNFEGLLTVANTHDIATADDRVTSPTILDSIRVGITEVRRSGYTPDTLLIDPIDMEEVLLLKGTDNDYVGGAFPSNDAGAGFRIWGLRVVESQAMEASNGERNLIVIDSRRAATLVVRTELEVLVGMINDDFTRNRRRLLAESRSAFVIYAPQAIAKLQTAAGGS